MDTVNLALTGLFDVLLYPFRYIHPMWGLAAVSVLTGAVMVWIFGKVSNQRKIRELKTRIKAHLLEMWIFRDTMTVVFKAQMRVLRATLNYAACSMRGLLVVMIPVILVMIQLQARYGYEPLKPGQSRIVKICLKEATPLDRMNVELEPSRGVLVETPPLRIPESREVSFRVKAVEPGEHEISVVLGGVRVRKTICAGQPGYTMSSLRTSRLLDRVFHPIERSLPDGPVESVEVEYRSRDMSWWGMEFHWLWAFFVFSLLAGFSLKRFFGVEV
jgi:hypothetical protein